MSRRLENVKLIISSVRNPLTQNFRPNWPETKKTHFHMYFKNINGFTVNSRDRWYSESISRMSLFFPFFHFFSLFFRALVWDFRTYIETALRRWNDIQITVKRWTKWLSIPKKQSNRKNQVFDFRIALNLLFSQIRKEKEKYELTCFP